MESVGLRELRTQLKQLRVNFDIFSQERRRALVLAKSKPWAERTDHTTSPSQKFLSLLVRTRNELID